MTGTAPDGADAPAADRATGLERPGRRGAPRPRRRAPPRRRARRRRSVRSPPTAWPASSARTRTTSPRSSPRWKTAPAPRRATAPSSSAASSVPARPRSTSASSPASPSPWPTPIFASPSPAPPPRPASTSSRRTRRDGDRRRCRRDVARLSEEDDMATQVTDGAAGVTWPATTGRRPLRREACAGPTIGDDARAMYPPHRASPPVSIAGRGASYPHATRRSPRASPLLVAAAPRDLLAFLWRACNTGGTKDALVSEGSPVVDAWRPARTRAIRCR